MKSILTSTILTGNQRLAVFEHAFEEMLDFRMKFA
jgi:hypothetical protein